MEYPATENEDESEAISLEMPLLLILDPVSVPLFGHKSTKKVFEGFSSITSVEILKSQMKAILAKQFQVQLEKESFRVQYFDKKTSGFVDVDRVEHLKAQTKLRLRLVPNVTDWVEEDDPAIESLAIDRSAQNVSVDLDDQPATGGGPETPAQAAEATASVTILDDEPERPPEIERFLTDLRHGIPVQKHSAKHGSRLPRILFCDSKCEMISWRGKQSFLIF